jgi:hypothetical protein
MKAKTQVIISLCGAMFLMGYFIFSIYYQWPLRLSKTWTMCIFIFPFIVLITYVINVIRKDLRTVKVIFGIWQIFAIVALFFGTIILGLLVISSGEVNYKGVYKGVPILFLNYAIPYGITTLIIWMGLKGLKQIIEAENKSKIENIMQTEESEMA